MNFVGDERHKSGFTIIHEQSLRLGCQFCQRIFTRQILQADLERSLVNHFANLRCAPLLPVCLPDDISHIFMSFEGNIFSFVPKSTCTLLNHILVIFGGKWIDAVRPENLGDFVMHLVRESTNDVNLARFK